MNVFQKCLRRQMGSQTYIKYYEKCQEKFSTKSVSQLVSDDQQIYEDIYETLKRDNQEGIEEKKQDMLDTLVIAARITKYFVFVLLAYALGNIALLALNLDYYVTCVSILLMGVSFIYKLIEYVSNKYCVLDVYLFMVYRTVLEKRAQEVAS